MLLGSPDKWKLKGCQGSIFLNKPFIQTMWTKIRVPRYLLIVLLVINSSYALVRTEKQTALFDQSDKGKENGESWGKSQGNEPNNRLDEATFAVDCDNSTLYKIQVDFTSTVVENGLYFRRCDTVCNWKRHFSNFPFTSFYFTDTCGQVRNFSQCNSFVVALW